MCGIVGLVEHAPARAEGASPLVAMRDAMRSRGPDDAGEAILAQGAVQLGHRRLAIIELSDLGHQPMTTPDGRLTIVYNGEIYNHLELRPELERRGCTFASGSDTETILAAYRVYGPAAFERLRGMFAMAIWDEEQRELILARDPHGIKPLYYRRAPSFAFASQVTGLLADPSTDRQIDPEAVAGFAVWGSVPEPCTIVRGISALPAGHFLRVSADGVADDPVRASRDEPASLRKHTEAAAEAEHGDQDPGAEGEGDQIPDHHEQRAGGVRRRCQCDDRRDGHGARCERQRVACRATRRHARRRVRGLAGSCHRCVGGHLRWR